MEEKLQNWSPLMSPWSEDVNETFLIRKSEWRRVDFMELGLRRNKRVVHIELDPHDWSQMATVRKGTAAPAPVPPIHFQYRSAIPLSFSLSWEIMKTYVLDRSQHLSPGNTRCHIYPSSAPGHFFPCRLPSVSSAQFIPHTRYSSTFRHRDCARTPRNGGGTLLVEFWPRCYSSRFSILIYAGNENDSQQLFRLVSWVMVRGQLSFAEESLLPGGNVRGTSFWFYVGIRSGFTSRAGGGKVRLRRGT